MRLLSGSPAKWIGAALLAFALAVSGLAGTPARERSDRAHTPPGEVVHECDRLEYFSDSAEFAVHMVRDQAFRDELMMQWRQGGPAILLGGPSAATFMMDEAGFSGTNVQVEGVDEVDILKTDGTHAYMISGEDVVIARVYPPGDARIVSRLTLAEWPTGLFLDGRRLVVFSNMWSTDWGYHPARTATSVRVYDVGDPSSPVLVRQVEVDGWQVGARLVDGHVYVVLSHFAYLDGELAVLPALRSEAGLRQISASEVGYFRNATSGHGLTMVLAIDLHSDAEVVLSPFLTGAVGNLYMTSRGLYLAGSVYRVIDGGAWDLRTTIHALDFDGLSVRYTCSAEVPGSLSDQFSMDEHGGHLRVATTLNGWGFGTEMSSSVYVLDASLKLVGSVEGIAPGETLHSVRFLGERGYLVTFKKIDPFFVLDFSEPSNPQVLGQLKIPGFSDYLHPFGPHHVIGVGKDAYDMGEFAWFQGVKLSLFDVSDPLTPREVANVVIGDRGTESEVLYDHKAFLLIPGGNLLVIPILLAEASGSEPNDYGLPVWQGAFVFEVSQGAFVERHRISHGSLEGDAWEYTRTVKRSFHIEDVLYTVSPGALRMHDLDTWDGLGWLSFT